MGLRRAVATYQVFPLLCGEEQPGKFAKVEEASSGILGCV